MSKYVAWKGFAITPKCFAPKFESLVMMLMSTEADISLDDLATEITNRVDPGESQDGRRS